MSQGVELYGRRLADVPVIGERIDNARLLTNTANALTIGRAACGVPIAGYVLLNRPEERSMAVTAAVGVAAATDRLDGDIMRAVYSSMGEDEAEAFRNQEVFGVGRVARYAAKIAGVNAPESAGEFGGWADHMSDKAFVYPPLAAFTVRREVPSTILMAKTMRDRRTNGDKAKIMELGEPVPKVEKARWKTVVDMASIAIGSGPLAARRTRTGHTWTEVGFMAGTVLSEASAEDYKNAREKAEEYARSLADAVAHIREADIEELIEDWRDFRDKED